MDFYGMLHGHSTHSDGVLTPAEMVKVAKAEGYKAIAITDHDTATAYPELKAACEEEGMECLFGVEFSSSPTGLHLVAFSFDPEEPEIKQYLADMGERQTDNTHKCFNASVERGTISGITWDEVLEYNKGIPWICNNHLFRAMMAKGLVKQDDYMNWWNINFKGQPGKYPPIKPFKHVPDIVNMVKKAGGFVICAHPTGPWLTDERIDQLIQWGIEGLEVYHPDLTPEEQQRAYQIAMDRGLFISGGQDHCGRCGGLYSSYKSEEELKNSVHYIPDHSCGVLKEHFEELKAHKLMR